MKRFKFCVRIVTYLLLYVAKCLKENILKAKMHVLGSNFATAVILSLNKMPAVCTFPTKVGFDLRGWGDKFGYREEKNWYQDLKLNFTLVGKSNKTGSIFVLWLSG